MERKKSKVKRRSKTLQGIIGVFCLAALGFVGVWAFNNAMEGFNASKADPISAVSQVTSRNDSADTGAENASSLTDDTSVVPDESKSEESKADVSGDGSEAESEAGSTPEETEDSSSAAGEEDSSSESEADVPGDTNAGKFPTAAEIKDDFADAVFIGNSRTVGLGMNCGKPLATFYASTGLNVNTIWDSATITLDNGSYGTVFDALAQKQFSRVYVMFGINEVGWPYWDSFQSQYEDVVNKIKELQPDARVYIQSVLPVSSLAINTNAVFTTENIDGLNEFIKNAAANTGCTYLDVNSALRQEDGSLPLEASTDGIHLMKDYCMVWLKYLADNS
ncbi:MAG: hypothetical protein IKO27_05605 [Ruminococcus sp.]|nr:hypothetical protein [Ruminococcus sp.]